MSPGQNHNVLDLTVGGVTAAMGSAGATIQLVSEVANLTAIVLNIILASGGLYLLWLRIKKARKPPTDPEG